MTGFAAAVAVAGGPPVRWASTAPDALLQALERHRLVARSERFADALPPAHRELLRPHWRAAAARSLGQRAAFDRVRAVLAQAGLPAVGLKGVILQEILHGQPTGRDAVDLDVLVPAGRLLDAVRALRDAGWRFQGGFTLDMLRGPLPSELPLHHPALGVSLDVHQRLFAPRYAFDAAERALEPRVVGDRHDLLGAALLVGLTGGKDLWNTLRHLLDLADALERVGPDPLAELADRTHTRGVLDVGAALVERVLERPTGWTARTRCPRVLPALIAALQGPLVKRPTAARLRGSLACRERARDRARMLARLPFGTAGADLLDPGPGPRPLRRSLRLIRTYGCGTGSGLG